MIKKASSMLMVLTIILAMVPGVHAAQSGTWGDNGIWTFDNGTLTISGSGEVSFYGNTEIETLREKSSR